MSWARLDDRFDDNRKVKRVWLACPQALGLHVMALTYCTRHHTDGLVDREYVTEKAPQARQRDRMTQALVEAGLWDEHADGWTIHDFLEFNHSRQEIEDRRLEYLGPERHHRDLLHRQPAHACRIAAITRPYI